MQKIKLFLLGIILCFSLFANAQTEKLKPGFDKYEYLEMLRISARQIDTPWTHVQTPYPEKYSFAYRSPIVGLKNRWDLWISKDSMAVISIRGTTIESVSWLENFYAAMVPAVGELKISNSFTFSYHLADNSKAAVHVGWLLGMASLSTTILEKIDSCNKIGIKNFIIMGHSQGGAIAYLLTSYILNLQSTGHLSSDLHFKTYCSAAPKPGNRYYAYDFENETQPGWAMCVVNADDWVPEFPFSIQTINDFNEVNPFVDVNAIIGKEKFPANIILKRTYRRLANPPKQAQRRFERITGKSAYKEVKKVLPEFVQPTYYPSNDYVRTGIPIVLIPDEGYYKLFPYDSKQLFIHHLVAPYYYLAERVKE
ncbi:MAG: lipase family protein [Chitinophagales bacterium]